jgi:tRNA (guanine-N7-)-methyltransferase
MRRRTNPKAKGKLLAHETYLCTEPEKYKGQWSSYFNNSNPIHVELGTGRGQFITTLAEMNPDINYIGIEIKEEVLLKAVEKAHAKQLSNIQFLWYDINKIDTIFDNNELGRIYINFCDPWPKSRWEKRRLTHRSFLSRYKEILRQDGEIHFKTDNKDLFDFSLDEFSALNFNLSNVTYDLHNSETKDSVTTEYEDKFSAMGMKIHRCEAKK